MATILENFKYKEIELIKASNDILKGYGVLVKENYKDYPIEIVTWPKPDWRTVDKGTGNEGGTTEGIFQFEWKNNTLFGVNNAVNDKTDYSKNGIYTLGWNCNPNEINEKEITPNNSRFFTWHANYHPDGGQLFFPLDRTPFVAPLALPGDNITLADFKAFYFDGSAGLYIHPGVWHEAVFPLVKKSRFFDKQGKVHARISCDFAQEFNSYLAFPTNKIDL